MRAVTLLRGVTVKRYLVLVLLLLFECPSPAAAQGGGGGGGRRRRVVDVGVILDRKTWVGNISWACMVLAMEDFYANATHAGYSTRLRLHLRDTGPDVVDAASAGVDLLKNVRVQAIVGPQKSSQAKFLEELGNRSSVPIISFSANGPSGSRQAPYFIRTAWNDTSHKGEARYDFDMQQLCVLSTDHGNSTEYIGISGLKTGYVIYTWREVVPVFRDDDSNTRFIPDLVDALRQVDTRVSHRCKIHPSAKDDEIKRAISSLKYNWPSVFVVRMSYSLARKFFQLAKDEGMMGQGFVWITAYGLTDIFDVVGSPALDGMEGVLGVKPHVQDTAKLQKFKQRWREKYRLENTSLSEPTVSGLYAYDTILALALAVEKAGYLNSDFGQSVTKNGSTDFDRIGTSKASQKLRGALLKINLLGMNGKFHIRDMQLLSVNYEIINIVGQERRVVGFWTPEFGISSSLNMKADLDTVMWPGGSKTAPRGWLLPMNKTLKIGVPMNRGFSKFLRHENGPKGFCIDVFEELVRALPYKVPHTYQEFEGKGDSDGTYDQLVYKLYLKEFDAVVGDLTILANRSSYVDFTLPYTESGVRMLVPVRDRRQKTSWTFLKPLTADLWLGTGAFFVFTGFVVWFIEHRTNLQFRGAPASQIGSVFYFSFSTLVFAHKERIVNNLSRIAVVIWLFVMLIVQQSYTASLSSILTVEQLQPTIKNLDEVIRKGSYVGHSSRSFVPGLLKRLKIDQSKMIAFDSHAEYNEALSTGRVAVIVDVIPYLKVFLSQYCHNYTMIGPTYRFNGFGYAFPRGSPLTSDISRGILQLASNGKMAQMEKELYGNTSCPDKDDSQTSSSLTLHSFQGLFVITGASSMLALILHVVITIYVHRHDLSRDCSQRSWRECLAILYKLFHEGNSPFNALDKDEPTVANVDSTTEIPLGICNHIIMGNLGSDTDTGSPPEGEGTPGREVSVQDPEPLSLSYMHSERGPDGVASLSRNTSTIGLRQRSTGRTPS